MNSTLLFDNMPSTDFSNMRPFEVEYKEFVKRFETPEVKAILAKHGVHCGFHPDSGVTLIVPCASKTFNYDGIPYTVADEQGMLKLQQCINEIDRSTDVYIRTTWAGNCGLFADKEYYEHCSTTSYDNIIKQGDMKYTFNTMYCVSDFVRKFGKGQWFAVRRFNHYEWKVKNTEKTTDTNYEDVKEQILAYANEVASVKNAVVRLVKGRCAYQSSEYECEAFVVYRNGRENAFGQLGRFEISQNRFGDCSMEISVPCAGSYTVDLDIDNYKNAIRMAVNDIAH